MKNLTNEQRIRELQLIAELKDHLTTSGVRPDAVPYLLDTIGETPSGRSHILGSLDAPNVQELTSEVWATEIGIRVRQMIEQHEQADAQNSATNKERKLAEIQAIENPRERINAARRAGLA